ncbi:LysR family transcriptional regulator [Cysteiniphilum halobium]|uniref:LysR family transcriptional regulator n=1 Tax=Cysteiniphilum halobium TaxID=2219059 RepID=UPI003F853E1B
MFQGNFSLVQLSAFLAVAKHMSFTKAADALGITKSAISQNIKQLESLAKADLLIRTTRKVELTREGRKLLMQCQRLESEWFGISQLMSSFDEHPEGTLCISSNYYFVEESLAPIIKCYLQLYPSMKVQLILEERMPELYQEKVDIVFGVNWAPPDDVVAYRLSSTDYVLCASPEYLQRKGSPKNISQLKSHDFIAHSERDAVLLGDPQLNAQCQSRLSVNSISCMKRFALDGLGIIQAHRYMLTEELKNGALVEIKIPDFTSPQVNINLYYQKQQYVQPKIKTFVELVKEMI